MLNKASHEAAEGICRVVTWAPEIDFSVWVQIFGTLETQNLRKQEP
jgi:hypothetical protein